MDQNLKWLKEKKIESLMAALKRNNFVPYYIENPEQLKDILETQLPKSATVAVGGSRTLFETGLIDFLRKGPYTFWDRYEEGLSPSDIREVFLKSFDADYYFTSTNALTEDGCLFNVDGTGNRTAAMIYGPKHVYVIVGINKIVADVDAAIERNKKIAAPTNAKRLSRNTPCAQTGVCSDCNSPDRVCSDYVLMKHQGNPERIHVFIVNEALGY